MTNWSEWIEHDGRGCPVPIGTPYECVAQGIYGKILSASGCAGGGRSWYWRYWGAPARHGNRVARIIRYRYRISGAMESLKAIAANPQPIEELA